MITKQNYLISYGRSKDYKLSWYIYVAAADKARISLAEFSFYGRRL